MKHIIDMHNNHNGIVIANGNDIEEVEEIVAKKIDLIYVIRFNPPTQLKENPKVRKLLSTYKKDDLEKYIKD